MRVTHLAKNSRYLTHAYIRTEHVSWHDNFVLLVEVLCPGRNTMLNICTSNIRTLRKEVIVPLLSLQIYLLGQLKRIQIKVN